MNNKINLSTPFSIIIPVYNEEPYVQDEIQKLIHGLKHFSSYEIILVENGSTDKTYKILLAIARKEPHIKVIRLSYPCYGEAVKKGLLLSRNPIFIQFDLDLIDPLFIKRALRSLSTYDLVVGSKILQPNYDTRPVVRIGITRFINYIIRLVFRYPGTDTHGVKAGRCSAVRTLIPKIHSRYHFFDTELLLWAYKRKLKIQEVPVSTKHLRPSRFSTPTRLVQAFFELYLLVKRRYLFI